MGNKYAFGSFGCLQVPSFESCWPSWDLLGAGQRWHRSLPAAVLTCAVTCNVHLGIATTIAIGAENQPEPQVISK